MALTKDKKNEVVGEVSELLSTSKMTVVASYKGLGVKSMQELRSQARSNGTKIKVVKNRLVVQAIKSTDKVKDVDVSALQGMLVYAFNSEDGAAAAQTLNGFAKTNQALQFVGAISDDGTFLSADEVTVLANLPTKDVLIGQLINQLLSPINDSVSAISGNLHALLDGVAAKAA
jgi:large subunit ribosomal protein L10